MEADAHSKGLLTRPNFYLSAYFEEHRDDYYDRLLAVSARNDWTGWCEFFLRALIAQAEANQRKAQEILSVYQAQKDWIAEVTNSQYAVRALDWMFARPIFKTSDFVETSEIPRPTSGRRAAVLTFSELLNIAEGRDAF